MISKLTWLKTKARSLPPAAAYAFLPGRWHPSAKDERRRAAQMKSKAGVPTPYESVCVLIKYCAFLAFIITAAAIELCCSPSAAILILQIMSLGATARNINYTGASEVAPISAGANGEKALKVVDKYFIAYSTQI